MTGIHKKSALLVAGGEIGDLSFMDFDSDFIIGIDRGVDSLNKLHLNPNLLIGDHDSSLVSWDLWNCEKILLPTKKNKTDTEAAIDWCIEKGISKITLIGGTGSRLDHTLGNIAVLTKAFEMGKEVATEGGLGAMRWVDKSHPVCLKKRKKQMISLIPITSKVTGVRTKGLLYELENEPLEAYYARGISNEWKWEEAEISVESGELLVVMGSNQ